MVDYLLGRNGQGFSSLLRIAPIPPPVKGQGKRIRV
jgi:hypothetical protein